MNRFQGGLVFKAHSLVYHSTLGLLVYHSTLGLRVIKKKKRFETREPSARVAQLSEY